VLTLKLLTGSGVLFGFDEEFETACDPADAL
jgi:hypothetical protein